MRAAGNWNRIDEARERSFHLEAALASERARSAETLAREDLAAALGVDAGADGLRLAERLPELPPSIEDLPDVERMALENRIDLKMMRARLDALAKDLKLTRATRFVNVLDAGPTRVQQGPARSPTSPATRSASRCRCSTAEGRACARPKPATRRRSSVSPQAAIEARAEVRKAYARYRAAHDIAMRQRDEVLPLRKAIAEEDLLRYDAAQISVFDLLADARSEIGASSDYIQSVRDFWIAKSALDAALAGPAPQPEEISW